MTDTWFTADFHLGHRNIIRYCNRPFRDVDEMDSAILDRPNAAAKERDILYFLGDFCLGGAKHAEHYLNRIRCKRIHFTKGNHDKTLRKFQDRFIWSATWRKLVFTNSELCFVACRAVARTSWLLVASF